MSSPARAVAEATVAMPDMVALTPTGLEQWLACPRRFLDAEVLRLPASDPGPAAGEGLLVHDLLRHLHEGGGCADDDRRAAVLEAHACNGRVGGFLEAHVRRCPAGALSLGHERELARFHRLPGPIFMATGRIDALWSHDGILDARDYKTGSVVVSSVAEDAKARLQAWLLAPLAERAGLSLRLRYECLSADVTDDPDPFEPGPEELDAIEEELREVVAAIRAERAFAGVSDPGTCRGCRWRSVCPDSAVPGRPAWTPDRQEDVLW
jgi:PD-(D/E)XK nuclease superfamily protein